MLVFQEMLSPTIGQDADADRTRRHVVRLTAVQAGADPSGRLFDDPPVDAPAADHRDRMGRRRRAAVPAVHVGARAFADAPIAVAWGNIVLVDHGCSHATAEPPGQVPRADICSRCRLPAQRSRASRRPRAAAAALPAAYWPKRRCTHGFDLARAADAARRTRTAGLGRGAAARATRTRRAAADPRSQSELGSGTDAVDAQRDLLGSGADATDFVVEIDDDGARTLRFGDDAHGRRPDDGTDLHRHATACGNGVAGNVGAGSASRHVVLAPTAWPSITITNPLPAFGGVDPEDVEAARRDAPAGLPHAAARGHRRTTTPTPPNGAPTCSAPPRRSAGPAAGTRVRHCRPRRRRARSMRRSSRGCAATLSASAWPATTSRSTRRSTCALDIDLHVCVRARPLPRAGAARRCATCCRPACCTTARLGLFHPDRFSFGAAVYLSRIVAAAQAVQGVESVRPVASSGWPNRARLACRWRDPHRPPRDRAACRRPELPRTRAAGDAERRRQMSRQSASVDDCRCCEGLRPRRREPALPNRPTYRRPDASATASAPGPTSRRAWLPGCRAHAPGAGEAGDARRRRLHARPDRCLRLRRRRAHLLPGAHRQRVLAAHRGGAHVAAGDGQADRLPPAPRAWRPRPGWPSRSRRRRRPPPGLTAEPGAFVTGVPTQIATLAAGLQVQSVPGPDEKPQTFETVEAVAGAAGVERGAAVAERAVRARCLARVTWLAGVRTGLKAGDAVVFVGMSSSPTRAANDTGTSAFSTRWKSTPADDRTRRELAAAARLDRSAAKPGRAAAGLRPAQARRRLRSQRADVEQHDHGLPPQLSRRNRPFDHTATSSARIRRA